MQEEFNGVPYEDFLEPKVGNLLPIQLLRLARTEHQFAALLSLNWCDEIPDINVDHVDLLNSRGDVVMSLDKDRIAVSQGLIVRDNFGDFFINCLFNKVSPGWWTKDTAPQKYVTQVVFYHIHDKWRFRFDLSDHTVTLLVKNKYGLAGWEDALFYAPIAGYPDYYLAFTIDGRWELYNDDEDGHYEGYGMVDHPVYYNYGSTQVMGLDYPKWFPNGLIQLIRTRHHVSIQQAWRTLLRGIERKDFFDDLDERNEQA
jgi:hypothetical protein